MRPDCISAEERLSAKEQESKNRGSWRLIPSLDITAVLEELNRGQLYIYTLFELGIISETDTTTLLQIIQEDPKVLHLFVSYASASNIRITDAEDSFADETSAIPRVDSFEALLRKGDPFASSSP